MTRTLLATVCCVAGLVFPASGQMMSKLNFNVGAGFSEPVVHTDGRLDPGFNVNLGVGANLVPHFGLNAEFGFNQLGITRAALDAAGGIPGGTNRIYSVTLNPIIHLNPRGRFDAYAIGGGGFYRRTIEFTAPTTSTVTAFDPFYGMFFPVAVTGNTVLGSNSQNKAGWNIGGGISVRLKGDSRTKFYAESRYHYIYTTPIRTTVLPVTFGFRW